MNKVLLKGVENPSFNKSFLKLVLFEIGEVTFEISDEDRNVSKRHQILLGECKWATYTLICHLICHLIISGVVFTLDCYFAASCSRFQHIPASDDAALEPRCSMSSPTLRSFPLRSMNTNWRLLSSRLIVPYYSSCTGHIFGHGLEPLIRYVTSSSSTGHLGHWRLEKRAIILSRKN